MNNQYGVNCSAIKKYDIVATSLAYYEVIEDNWDNGVIECQPFFTDPEFSVRLPIGKIETHYAAQDKDGVA